MVADFFRKRNFFLWQTNDYFNRFYHLIGRSSFRVRSQSSGSKGRTRRFSHPNDFDAIALGGHQDLLMFGSN